MGKIVDIVIPDLGADKDVDLIDIMVSVGDKVEEEDGLITLETEKASMDVPTTHGGIIKEILVKVGDKVNSGDLIARVEVEEETTAASSKTEETKAAPVKPTPTSKEVSGAGEVKGHVLVIGAGPGGYSAAFRCADLGMDTVLVERHDTLGGVCLNVGCIPSKALLHVAKVIEEAEHISHAGIKFTKPEIDLPGVAAYKSGVVKRLTDGLSAMAKMRNIKVIQGTASFIDENSVIVNHTKDDGKTVVKFDNCIIAAGSQSSKMSFIPHEDPRIWDSTNALEVKEVPKKMLIMGGGIIGLEMGTVYQKLGSEVDVVIRGPQVMTGTDKDIVKVYTKANEQRFNFMFKTQTQAIIPKEEGIYVEFKGDNAPEPKTYDAVLVAMGRSANGLKIGLENTKVEVDEKGLIKVDKQMRTTVPHIFAIGDIVGQPMLAHKAVHEGHVAAEVIAGHKVFFEPKQIPGIAYTFPEIATAGMSEIQAKEAGINYEVASFPWTASGRAIASDVSGAGMTKLIFDKDTDQLIGGAIVGDNAGELLGEISLALEMDCDAEDIGLTIHAHPTLHESVGMCAEIFHGSITDLPNGKAVKK
ncbi:dihydrolipoyl dehydrogenase [Halarcobacter anaerophilus]|uniref:Dihydrolipoyl dehydrogenase n=1 Tax=Halarcobacter anaerophilus TaxID=877500 RepID=A0A4Q0Y2S4_9BACT|nr:dihydrolipoyl dehydrogenase [Halarcobacter anaerophilus]QDF28864.1 pyruvate dehydrogenase multienzyme complex, E3 component dihydrolipoyl dehydrogenase [Halarcobacter anaerophilus]RXJ63504.1 dihydrolipoyl dehydrogenase [Halarcobacter anaerophilus]